MQPGGCVKKPPAMLRTILKVAVVLVIFVLVYNYFFGTSEEKAQSKEIFQEVKDVGVAVKDLLKSEKEKFDAGKYDNAIKDMRELIGNMESKAREVAPEYVDRVKQLEQKRKDLENQLEETKNTVNDVQEKARKIDQLNNDLDQLMKETEQVEQEIRRKSEPD